MLTTISCILLSCAGSDTRPNSIHKIYTAPIFDGSLGQVTVNNKVSLHVDNFGFDASDIQGYVKKQLTKSLKASSAFSNLSGAINVSIKQILITDANRKSLPAMSNSKVTYVFSQYGEPLLQVQITSLGSDVSFGASQAILRSVVKSLNHNIEGLISAFTQYSTQNTLIEKTVSSSGDVSTLDWIFVAPALTIASGVGVAITVASAAEAALEVIAKNSEIIQSFNQGMQQTYNQISEGRTRTQQLYEQAAKQRKRQQTENDRLRRIDSKKKRQQHQDNNNYRNRQTYSPKHEQQSSHPLQQTASSNDSEAYNLPSHKKTKQETAFIRPEAISICWEYKTNLVYTERTWGCYGPLQNVGASRGVAWNDMNHAVELSGCKSYRLKRDTPPPSSRKETTGKAYVFYCGRPLEKDERNITEQYGYGKYQQLQFSCTSEYFSKYNWRKLCKEVRE